MKRPDELCRGLESEAGLPGTAGPGDRQESRPVGEQCDELLELPLSPYERDRDDGQVGGVKRAERRELTVAELEESLGTDEVLQAVLAEIPNVRIALQETPGRRREDDLPSVRRRRDPCCTMDVDPDVAFVGQLWLPGVDADANADRAVRKRLAGSGRRLDRRSRGAGSAS